MDEGELIPRGLGVVTSFDNLTGSGVINTLYDDVILVERSSIRSKGVHSLVVGQTVEFLSNIDFDGNYTAFDVTASNESLFHGTTHGWDIRYGFNEGYGGGGEGYGGGYEGRDYGEIWDELDAWYQDFGDSGGTCEVTGHIVINCYQDGGGGGGCDTVGNKDPMDEGELIPRGLGVVTSFDNLKGSGVITTMYGDDLLVERSSIRSEGVHSLVVGQMVKFLVNTDSDGNYIALDVTASNESLFHSTTPGGGGGGGE